MTGTREISPSSRGETAPHGRTVDRGFTLLEVLVVVAIIALLTAILIPSLAKARQQAKRVACLSNLKQITIAWHLYLDAHQGTFFQLTNANCNYGGKQGSGSPAGLYDTKEGDPDWSISKPLNRYLTMPTVTHHAELFFCPAERPGIGATR